MVRAKIFNYIRICVTAVRYFKLEETFVIQRKFLVIYLFQTNWMELAMKFLMTRFFFYQKTHFSVEIFEMGFMQNILISSAGRPFILVPLVPAKIIPH